MNSNKTKIRYGVKYNDRNYEYALHSGKGHWLRNLADVINVIEYCVVQDFKKDGFTPSEKLYNVDVRRLINDGLDEEFEQTKVYNVNPFIKNLIDQMIADTNMRNA